MSNFHITLTNTALMILYMMIGYFLKSIKKSKVDDIPGISQILIFGLTPPMILSCFMKLDFSWENLYKMAGFFLMGLVIQLTFLLILLAACGKKRKEIGNRMMCAEGVMGNVGFFGLPIIQAVFPEEPIAACYVCVTAVSMNILLYSFGEYAVSGDKKYISFKAAFLNPTTLSFYVAMVFFVLNLKQYMPESLKSGIQLLGNMTAPLSMIVLGIRLASSTVKQIFGDSKAWMGTALKLIVFPLFTYVLMLIHPFDEVFKTTMLILMAAPSATILLSLAEIHHGGEQTAANSLLLTSILCVITIPLLTLLKF